MVQINFAKREVQCKVVYYGPARSGKTTNLRSIHERSPERVRGQLTTIATDTNRTLFFDFLPLDLGDLAGIRAKIHLYAIPYITGQNAMRVLVLEGVDGIVFVADAAPHRLQRNQEAFENLRQNLAQLGRDLADIPVVWQWNKTDLPDAMSEADLDQALNPQGQPAFPAAAEAGTGVFTTLKAMTQAVLAGVSKMMVPASEVAKPGPAPAAAPAEPARVAAMPAPQPPAPPPAPQPVAPLPALPSQEPVPESESDPDPAPRPSVVPLATPGLPDTQEPAPEPTLVPAPDGEPRRVAAFEAPVAPLPALPTLPSEPDPVTESRPAPETVPVPVPPLEYRPLPAQAAAEEPTTYVPPWRKGDGADPRATDADPESESIGPSEPRPQDDFEFELSPEFAAHAESDPPTKEIEAESYPEPFTDLPAAETDPDPTTADNPELRQSAPVVRSVRRDHWDEPRATAPLPTVPIDTYRAPARAEPEYVDPGADTPGHFTPTASGTERYVSVGGRATPAGPEIIHGWDEPRPRRRLAREARPVVDRRKAPRADETLQNVPVSHLAAGAAFGLFSLIVIGYLVHTLL